jgi:hypothetical protein
VFIRVETRDALKAAIETLTTIRVTKGWNAPDSADEEIFLGPTRGNVTYDVFAATAMPHDDQFTIDVLIHAASPGQTQDQAEERVQTMANIVVEALADPTFNDLSVNTGTMSAFLFDAVLADSELPETNPVDEGYEAYGSVTVAVHTRGRYL